MNLHHDALVLVADGQKYLLLRNGGDFRNPVLKVEASAERSGAPTRDLGSDQPGRAFSSAGGTPSAMEQTELPAVNAALQAAGLKPLDRVK